MSPDYYRRQVKQLNSNLSRVRRKHTDLEKKAAKLSREITDLERKAAKTNSDGLRRNYLSSRESKQRQLDGTRNDIASCTGDVAKVQDKIADAEANLTKAEVDEAKKAEIKRERDEQQRRRREAQERHRAEATRRAADAARDQQLDEIGRRAGDLERRLEEAERKNAPPEIVVLFLASSPEDQEPLRLDKETREIQKRMRATDYPDSMAIEWRPARQLSDLIQDLNEVAPGILHFSGHSDSSALLFENDAGETTELTNELLSKLLAAAGHEIRLAVFNSCESASQARLAVDQVDLAIGLETTIADEHAKTFAGAFYSALGFGHSVQTAFDQAKLQVEVEHGEALDSAVLVARDGVDPATVVLVNPDADVDGSS